MPAILSFITTLPDILILFTLNVYIVVFSPLKLGIISDVPFSSSLMYNSKPLSFAPVNALRNLTSKEPIPPFSTCDSMLLS